MKIVYVTNEYPSLTDNYGGIAVVIKNEVEGLIKKGYFVEVVLVVKALNDRINIPNYVCPFYWPKVKFLSGIFLRIKLFIYLNKKFKKTDIIVCTDYSGLLPFNLKSQKIVQLHGSLTINARQQNKEISFKIFLLEYLTILFSDKIRAVSNSVLIETHNCFPLTNRIHSKIIYNGIKNTLVNSNAPDHFDNSDIIFIGKLSRLKGIDFLGEIINKVHCQMEDVKFTLIGHDELNQLISNKTILLNQVKLKAKVKFIDRIDNSEISQILRKSSILILTSRRESLPMVIIEAFENAIPVVAFDVGGIPEMIVDNVNGFLVPAFDTSLFADKLVRLLSNPVEYQLFATNAKEKYINDFVLDDILDKLEKFYIS